MGIRNRLCTGIAAGALALGLSMAVAPDAHAQGRTMWEGFHVGGHLGWVGSDYNHNRVPFAPIAPYDDDASGVTGGIVYGTSWQFGYWVLGTDSDFSWSDADTSLNTTAGGSFTLDTKWSSSSRLRAGFLMNQNFMLYGTAGIAFAKVEGSGAFFAGDSSKRLTGFQYGVGIEAMLHDRWFARAEYLRTDYGSKTIWGPGGGVRVDLDTDVVRGAVGYRFDWSPFDILR